MIRMGNTETVKRGDLKPGDMVLMADDGGVLKLKIAEVPPVGRAFQVEVDGEKMWGNFIWFEDGSHVLAGSRETFERIS